jgi:hypothetical protein
VAAEPAEQLLRAVTGEQQPHHQSEDEDRGIHCVEATRMLAPSII